MKKADFFKRIICVCLIFSFLFSIGGNSFAATKYYVKKGYKYSKPVPKSGAKSDSYFNDAIFMGDSRTVDLFIYSSLQKTSAKNCADIGLNIGTAFTKEFVSLSMPVKKGKKTTTVTQKVTILDYLRYYKGRFKKVYLMFGLNDLNVYYKNSATFIKKYNEFINEIRKINPKLKIYVNSVIAVTKARDKSDKRINIRTIKTFNKKIKSMCKKKKVFYLDITSATTNSKGYLPSKSTGSDGIHFNPSYCEKWLSYLKSHTV